MAIRNNRGGNQGCAALPDAVPFDLSHLTRQSWELGKATVQDEHAATRSRWAHQTDQWQLSIFEVTSETVIICIRTPVGRERFYGAMQSELESAMQKLEANPSWQQVA
jgi:hypothetical protein